MSEIRALVFAWGESLSVISDYLTKAGMTVVTRDPDRLDVDLVPDDTSVIVIDEGAEPDKRRGVLRLVKRLRPDIPVVWHVLQAVSLTSFSKYHPDFVVASMLDPGRAWSDVADRLRESPIPDEFKERIKQVLRDGVQNAFGVSFELTTLYIQSTSTIAHPVNTLLPFVSDRVGGHIAISGDDAALGSVWERLMPGTRPKFVDEQDLAGEIANVAIGRLKELLLGYQSSLSLGMPLYLGGDPRVLYRTSKSGLVVWGHVPGINLTLELYLKWADVANIVPTDPLHAHEGEFNWV